MQADHPLPEEDMVGGQPADEDSRVHTDVEESEDEVMQEQAQDEEEEDDGEDLMDNMEG